MTTAATPDTIRVNASEGRFNFLAPQEVSIAVTITGIPGFKSFRLTLDADKDGHVLDENNDWSDWLPDAVKNYRRRWISSDRDEIDRFLVWLEDDENLGLVQLAWARRRLVSINSQIERLAKQGETVAAIVAYHEREGEES